MEIEESGRIKDIHEYYFASKMRQIAAMNKEKQEVVNLGIGSPDIEPDRSIVQAANTTLLQRGIHGYQSYNGINELRVAIANWSEKIYEIQTDPQREILLLNGSKEAIMFISLAFLNEGDVVLIPNPGYPTYSAATKIAGGKIINYDVCAEHGVGIEQIIQLTETFRVKILWLNSPHMPTGTSISNEAISRLIAICKTKGILLVNDNPYGTILTSKAISIFQHPGAKGIAIELNSLSKSHNMAGWRVGWLCGNPHFIAAVTKVKSNMDSGMFLPIQKGAIAALNIDGQQFERNNEIYLRRRKIAWEIFDQLGCTYYKSTTGMFVWGKINNSKYSGEMLSERVLEIAKVFITPGYIFGSNGANYLRISLCSSDALLNESLKRVRNNINHIL